MGNERKDPRSTLSAWSSDYGELLRQASSAPAKSKMKKAMFFLAGLASGIVLTKHWRPLAKGGIKAGIRAGRKVKEVSQQAVEDIEDVTAEALEELSEEEREGPA
jgi:hypothetical protein